MNYQETEERIRNLVPRLKELSFGCEFIWCNNLLIVVDRNEMAGKVRAYPKITEKEIFRAIDTHRIKPKGIIGHPIDLEAVLEALVVSGKPKPYCFFAGKIFEIGDSLLSNSPETFLKRSVASWQYGKPFSEQDEETQLFIHKLLK